MFYIRDEGEVIRDGFNFYPLSSNQFGVCFRYGKKEPVHNLGIKMFQLRYNKRTGKWFVGTYRFA
jgi:hypothetical protein